MLSDEFLNQIFQNNQEKIDRKISYEYHKTYEKIMKIILQNPCKIRVIII